MIPKWVPVFGKDYAPTKTYDDLISCSTGSALSGRTEGSTEGDGASSFGAARTGNRTENFDPLPSLLSTAISPPCTSSTILTRYRPTPVPTIPDTLLPR